MMRSARRARAVVVALVGTVFAPGVVRAEAAPAAVELVRQARAHEAAHEEDVALRRYAEALAIDPTLADAYLGLGALRLQLGDAREAERVYDAGLTHVLGFAPGLLGRGRARRAQGERALADADVEAYVEATNDPSAIRQLAGWYGEEGRPLAQLAAWRRLRAAADRVDEAARKEARLTVRALEVLVGSADPVREPPAAQGAGASSVRRGMARMERRR